MASRHDFAVAKNIEIHIIKRKSGDYNIVALLYNSNRSFRSGYKYILLIFFRTEIFDIPVL